MQIERTCHFCNKKFKSHHNNHGMIYEENKIYVCKECIHVKVKCFICKKEISVLFTKKDKKCFCSELCQLKNNHKTMKENKTGLFNAENRAKGQKNLKDYKEKIKLDYLMLKIELKQ